MVGNVTMRSLTVEAFYNFWLFWTFIVTILSVFLELGFCNNTAVKDIFDVLVLCHVWCAYDYRRCSKFLLLVASYNRDGRVWIVWIFSGIKFCMFSTNAISTAQTKKTVVKCVKFACDALPQLRELRFSVLSNSVCFWHFFIARTKKNIFLNLWHF